MHVERLHYAEARRRISELAAVLADCVEGGASVSFMAGFSQADAERFFARVADEAGAGERVLLAALIDGRVMGTAQLILAMPPNQPHRAELSKMLVHRDARGRGLGRALLEAADAQAKAHGKTLITLDTASDVAERLYTSAGYRKTGTVPDFALLPDGRLCGTTFMWKRI